MIYKANKNAADSVPDPLTMKSALLLAHCFCAFLWGAKYGSSAGGEDRTFNKAFKGVISKSNYLA